jgi:uncharacterized protein (TIGR03000 family)
MVFLLAAGLWLSSGPAHGHGHGVGHVGGGHGAAFGHAHGGSFGSLAPGLYGLGYGGYGLGGSAGYTNRRFGLGSGYYPYGFAPYVLGAYGYRGPGYRYGPYNDFLLGFPWYGYSTLGTDITAEPEDPSGPLSRIDRPTSGPLPPDNTAHVTLIVPEDAKVWFNGVKTQKTGRQREFQSPDLSSGSTYLYDVKAQWQEKGKRVERAETVRVRPGAKTVLDLTRR